MNFIRLIKDLNSDIIKLKKENKSLKDKIRQLEVDAYTDVLTGLQNRKKVDINGQKHSAIIMCDIDHFKNINDTYGHNAGDNVLSLVGDVLKQNTRNTDQAIRWGGEEFLILLTDCTENYAKKKAEHIRKEIMNLESKTSISVTASLGVAERIDGEPLKEIIEKADAALYHSKNTGRNLVTSYGELKQSPKEVAIHRI